MGFRPRPDGGRTMTVREDLRNVAIIAHVDHGKTTLVDQMLKQSGTFRENQAVEERVMDSNDIERERGITILAKNTSIKYKDTKINIIDTPGHADFGGEVERVLKMVNGVILLVDAAEGPMPQTRFVLQKALELGHKIIIAVNKIDKPDARLNEVVDEVLDLLIDLDATYEQLDSPVLFCSGRDGTASLTMEIGKDMTPLFDMILEYIPAPKVDTEGSMQYLVSAIDYNEYVGRIASGRIERGEMKVNQDVTIGDFHETKKEYRGKIVTMYQIEGLERVPGQSAKAGDIVCISGIENITIGDTICQFGNFEPIPFVKISEPTVEMTFSVNNSPFAGREGKFVTSSKKSGRMAALNDQNGAEVAVTSVDEIDRSPTYIKTDIEGFEERMLNGAKETLKTKPKLNLAAYHRTGDFFRLILQINRLNPDYMIYLRKHPYIPCWDLNIYAV